MKEQGIVSRLFRYVALLFCTSVVAALAWSVLAYGVLFRCNDQLLHLWPPFVHAGSGDMYLAPARAVMVIWVSLVAVVLILPALMLWTVRRSAYEGVERSSSQP